MVRNEEATSSYPLTSHFEGQQAQNHVVHGSTVAHVGFPPYSLPQCYTPLIGEYPKQEHVTIIVPVNTSDPNATCLNTVKMATSTGPQMTASQEFCKY